MGPKKKNLILWEIPWGVWMFLLASFAILSRTLCSHSWKDNSHFHSFLSFNHYEDHKLQYCTALSGSKFSGHFLDPSVNHWNAMELNFLFIYIYIYIWTSNAGKLGHCRDPSLRDTWHASYSDTWHALSSRSFSSGPSHKAQWHAFPDYLKEDQTTLISISSGRFTQCIRMINIGRPDTMVRTTN